MHEFSFFCFMEAFLVDVVRLMLFMEISYKLGYGLERIRLGEVEAVVVRSKRRMSKSFLFLLLLYTVKGPL